MGKTMLFINAGCLCIVNERMCGLGFMTSSLMHLPQASNKALARAQLHSQVQFWVYLVVDSPFPNWNFTHLRVVTSSSNKLSLMNNIALHDP